VPHEARTLAGALTFKDRDSYRQANVAEGTQWALFWSSVVLLVLCLSTELARRAGHSHQNHLII